MAGGPAPGVLLHVIEAAHQLRAERGSATWTMVANCGPSSSVVWTRTFSLPLAAGARARVRTAPGRPRQRSSSHSVSTLFHLNQTTIERGPAAGVGEALGRRVGIGIACPSARRGRKLRRGARCRPPRPRQAGAAVVEDAHLVAGGDAAREGVGRMQVQLRGFQIGPRGKGRRWNSCCGRSWAKSIPAGSCARRTGSPKRDSTGGV